ncbi:hypothetical protein FSP39_001286 [Pinctada imbricata]|uniref:Uncharacterized protein n=1 Tax=Pinctada imbricata TaxID=66713 RepID=A0AA88Y2J6_PINIB|nr:hypothetical protein FSP39_001286 [Pinctada imbricata]
MEGTSRQLQGKYPDGRIASAIFCAFVTSILLVILEAFSPIQKQTDIAHVLVWILQVASMTLGIIATSLIFWTAYQHTKCKTESESESRNDDPSMGLKLLFLWFFAFSLLLQTSFSLAVDLDCLFKGEARPFPLLLSAFSALISMTFTIIQVGFISYAREADLPKTSKAVLCLLTVVVANLAIWFNSFVRDQNNLFAIGNMSQYLNESILRNETLCFWKSPIQKVAEGLLPYLVPARLEFGLFASSFLLRL